MICNKYCIVVRFRTKNLLRKNIVRKKISNVINDYVNRYLVIIKISHEDAKNIYLFLEAMTSITTFFYFGFFARLLFGYRFRRPGH